MKSLIWIFVLIGIVFVLLILLKGKQRGDTGAKTLGSIKARRLLSKNEERMFSRLCETFQQPEYFVLTQVAFSALITNIGGNRAIRNTFDRKFADFVLCDKSMAVVGVIELDDDTHKGRETEDKARENLLTQVGYVVVRYPQVPEKLRLLADFAPKPLPGISQAVRSS